MVSGATQLIDSEPFFGLATTITSNTVGLTINPFLVWSGDLNESDHLVPTGAFMDGFRSKP